MVKSLICYMTLRELLSRIYQCQLKKPTKQAMVASDITMNYILWRGSLRKIHQISKTVMSRTCQQGSGIHKAMERCCVRGCKQIAESRNMKRISCSQSGMKAEDQNDQRLIWIIVPQEDFQKGMTKHVLQSLNSINCNLRGMELKQQQYSCFFLAKSF